MHSRTMKTFDKTWHNPGDLMPLTIDPALFEVNQVPDVPSPEFPQIDLAAIPPAPDLPGSEPPPASLADFLGLAISRLDSLIGQFGDDPRLRKMLNAVAVLSIEAKELEQKLFAERLSAAEGRLEEVMSEGKKQLAVVASSRHRSISAQMALDNLSAERQAIRHAIAEFPAVNKLGRFHTRADRLARDKKLEALRDNARAIEKKFATAIADANAAQAALREERAKLRDIDVERQRLENLLAGGKHTDPELGLAEHGTVPLVVESNLNAPFGVGGAVHGFYER